MWNKEAKQNIYSYLLIPRFDSASEMSAYNISIIGLFLHLFFAIFTNSKQGSIPVTDVIFYI